MSTFHLARKLLGDWTGDDSNMVDTKSNKAKIEPHLRAWLAAHFPGQMFAEKSVELKWGGSQ